MEAIIIVAIEGAAALVGDIIAAARQAGHPVDVPTELARLNAAITARAEQVSETEAAVKEILDGPE